MLNPEIKAAWIEILRSPVRQITGAYSDDSGGLCGLGCLRRAISRHVRKISVHEPWAGLDPTQRRTVIYWNDTERLTLPQIADRVEAEF